MRPIFYALMLLSAVQGSVLKAGEAETERFKGVEALKESQTNPQAIVAAARHFASASDLYAKAGNESKATEMNSYLFWCKKKMTIQDIDQFVKGGETAVADKLVMVEKIKPEADESQAWFDRADKFAKENPDEHYLIEVRFFEVASRFIGSKASLAAQERSLREQTLAQEKLTKSAPAVADKSEVPESADPIKKRLAGSKQLYAAELENARKATLEALAKREADARKIGNKKVVDEVKEERAAFEAKKLFDQIQMYSPESKRKIAAAWKNLSAEYDSAIKAYTKAAKDDDANAVEKEFKLASDDYLVAASAPPKVGTDAVPAGFLVDKTFVAWVTLANLTQRKVAVISLYTIVPEIEFDAVVFGEVEPGKWMAGSGGLNRTQIDQKKNPGETTAPGAPIQIAISYHDREVSIYHNGKKIVHYQMTPSPLKLGADTSALFGVRQLGAECFSGSILDTRVYAEALSEAQIAALRPGVAIGPRPWAWWTFEDGTCRDHMGRFATGKSFNGAAIKGGVMVLNGKGYFKADPLLAKTK